jgi:putative ABC transport system permease protein
MLTGVVFGLAPAWQASKVDLTESLKQGTGTSTDGAHRNRLRGALVATEMALAVVLMVGAGLLINSLLRLERVHPGFDPRNVISLSLGLPQLKYRAPQQVRDFYQQLLSRIGALPGVAAASAVTPLPLSGDTVACSFQIEGRPTVRGEYLNTHYRSIGLGYFRAMRIAVVKGRDFTARDDQNAPSVIIINETLARRFFPNEDPLRKRIRPTISIGEHGAVMLEIVGIVGDVRHRSLRRMPDPEVYVPHAQAPFNNMTLVVRAKSDLGSIIAGVRNEVRAMDKDLPVYDVRTLDHYLVSSIAHPRFNTLLLAVFAGIALILAAVGLYGVMSYAVAQRTHEIGIRVALGAQARDVLKLIMGQGMKLALTGLVIGVAGASALARVMSTLLFGISTLDPATFTVIPLLLAAIALLACYIPARRATKVDPIVALRYE